ncbi:MAG: dTDP-4-dehydrorhamnose reductase [Planctomycetes bacterium]|jgi:dTDP-4-dehydrorhamnose reductase|nr:dTDP-4-dehydrorhamnose reductase [Planctomycetota bacterium]
MLKILILGAKGNLGSALVKVFSGNDYDLTGWDKEEIDITDAELIMKKVKDIKPGLIINAAAYNAVDKCEESEEEYDLAKKINIDGPRNLAEAALAVGATFMHYSSDYVFNGRKKRGYKETDEAAPICRYGKTKAIGDRQVIALSGKGLKWYLIRSSKLFGPKGESAMAKPSFFDLMLQLCKNKKEFTMVDKEEISCFTYTPDLALATKKLVESDAGYGVYHIVNSGPASWYEAAKYLFELKGIKDVKLIPVRSIDYSRPAKRPKYSILLNTKLEPLRDWKEALREYLKISNI